MDHICNSNDLTHESPAFYRNLLEQESRPVSPTLHVQDFTSQGEDDFAVGYYLDQEWFDKEVEHVWKKTWQFACREDEIPNPGDCYVYDIVGLSLAITRGSDNKIRALHNYCKHRGRKLRTENGNISQFRCPYHAWVWDINGRITDIPCRGDFRPLTDDEASLTPVQIDTWGGFVFVNFDPKAPPLRTFLGALEEHFEPWGLEKCYTAAHVRKRISCNWKVGLEAFMEAYHTLGTHPQIAPFTGDTSTQVDTFGDASFNRMMTPLMVQSGQMDVPLDDQGIFDGITAGTRLKAMKGEKLPEGAPGREYVAQKFRESLHAASGIDYSNYSDADMIDVIQYFVFPNFFPWGGFSQNLVYQFRPDGKRVDSCTLDAFVLLRHDPNKERPAARPLNILTDEQPWAAAAELGGLGAVFDQDMDNMAYVHQGMEASRADTGVVILSKYLEGRIRKFHNQLVAAVERGESAQA